MEYLQYKHKNLGYIDIRISFKPYYKWNTFNTGVKVLASLRWSGGFKPYYKWNTFNTYIFPNSITIGFVVLNLIINGIPSIQKNYTTSQGSFIKVLNLIINGIPSIHNSKV